MLLLISSPELMMRILISLSILLAQSLILTQQVSADGLLYQLPEDGTSAEFELTGSVERGGQSIEFTGTVSMNSVGQEVVDGEACRWIEFRFTLKRSPEEQGQAAFKFLIPESEFAAGKNPAARIHKGWFKEADKMVVEFPDLTSPQAGPIPAFVAGAFADAKTLETVTVDSPLGKLECKQVTGSTTFKQGSRDHKYTLTTSLNESAPFGVVKSQMKIDFMSNGELEGTGTMNLTLKSVGKDAKAVIPNGK